MKRMISFILSAMLTCTVVPSALAAESEILFPAGTVVSEDDIAETEVIIPQEDDIVFAADRDDPEFALVDTERTYESLAEKPELTEEEQLEVFEALIAAQTEETVADSPAAASVGDDIKLLYRTESEFALTAANGLEYSIDGKIWNTTGVFTNIENGSEYTVSVRNRETGETVCTVTVAAALKPKAPTRPTAASIDRTSVTVQAESGTEYSMDGGSTWQTGAVFKDLTPGKEYTIIARYPEKNGALASEPSEPLTITTVPSDTYLVSSEAELLSALNEISTLPATKPRINVRFKNSITVSDTIVLPRLKGRMTVYLDLYGFTLKCTRANVPVVEINTRATLGSSYYLNSGVSSEQIRGGCIETVGNGCGIEIGAGAIVTLNGLTFNCDVAIENSGEIDTLENIHGRIKNSGYIGEITGTTLTVAKSGDCLIYNEGTIERITDCSLSDNGSITLYRGDFDEGLVGVIHNLGYIGSIDGTKITTGRPAAVTNGSGAQIDSLKDNEFKNRNYYRGTACLNYGTITRISDGSYFAWNSCFLNYGTITRITGGYFSTNSDSANSIKQECSEAELAYIKSAADVYSCFGNYGTIETVSGGVYYGGYSTYGRGWWYADGTAQNQDNCGENNRSWIDFKAFKNMSDSAVLNFADGYGMSRSMHKYKDYGSGFKVDKLYKVSYDLSEGSCYQKAKTGTLYDALIVEDNGTAAVSAPDYLYYCEGDTVYRNNPFARGYYGSADSGWLRNVGGQYLDCGKLTQYYTISNGSVNYENKYVADLKFDSMYYLSALDSSDPELMDKFSFKMPSRDVSYTPRWSYRQPGYTGFANSKLGSYETYRSAANSVLVNADFEVALYPVDSGFYYGITAHGLDSFLPFDADTSPVSGWEQYSDSTRPFHYEWSLDGTNWYENNEEIIVDSNSESICVYLKIVPNEDSTDNAVGSSKAFAAQQLKINLTDITVSSTPNGSTVTLTGKNEVTITAAMGTAAQLGDGLEVQLALEDENGAVTPYDFGSDSILYHNDITRPAQAFVISDIPEKSKLKARFRQYEAGYRYMENPQPDSDIWSLGAVSVWSAWQSVTAKADVAAPPTAPELIKRLDTSIIVKAEDGLEYSIDNGSTWQSGGEFIGLTPDTEYTIVSRFAETDLTNKSEKSPALTVKTRLADGVLSAPTLISKTDTSITIETKAGYEYSMDGGNTWQSNGEFTDLDFGTEYEIICRREDEQDYSSPALTVKTVFPAPTLVSRTDTSITIETKDGLEYSIDSINWQAGGEFTGLSAGTRYEITARKEADTDNISEPLTVSTKTLQGSPSAPPELVSRADTSITIETDPDMEYSIDGGNTWQKDSTFTGLSEGTEYEIISRFTETEDSAASAAGPALSVATKTYPTAEIIPPNVLSVTVSTISVEPEESQEYAVYTVDENEFVQGWYTDGEFSGLESNTKYKVVTRISETEDTVASDTGTAVVLVNTDRQYSSLGSGDSYIDAEPSELHYAYIYGFPDGTVRPQSAITRAESAAILARAFPQATALDLDTRYFTDTDPSAWYYEQVQLLASMGLLFGDGNGHFRPNDPITRAEFVSLAARFVKLVSNDSAACFTDTNSSWAQDSIDKMTAAGYICGYSDGTFKPQNNITRAEAISIVYRMVGTDCEKSREKRLWPDCNDGSSWYFNAIMEASVTHEIEVNT